MGALKGIDPETGHHYDDTKRYIDSIEWLTEVDREKIFAGNLPRVYPRFKRVQPAPPAFRTTP